MIKPETAFNALGGLMQLQQETIEGYQREIARLNQLVVDLARKVALLDSKGALQEQSSATVHVRGGSPGGSPRGDGTPLGEAHKEPEEAPRAKEQQVEGLGVVEEERLHKQRIKLSPFDDDTFTAIVDPS